MRRRSKASPEDVANCPPELLRFRAEEWPGGPRQSAGAFWDAREEWEAAHGEAPDLDWTQRQPDEPWGGV